jgi:hypothetical protein
MNSTFTSPHVTIASFLQQCTESYGVDVMMSAAFYKTLDSENMMSQCRLVDRVRLQGRSSPLTLYCWDVPYAGKAQNSRYVPVKLSMDSKQPAFDLYRRTMLDLDGEESIGLDPAYKAQFEEAIKYYLDGKWDDAFNLLTECKRVFPLDHPAAAILWYIEMHNMVAPSNWTGVRPTNFLHS